MAVNRSKAASGNIWTVVGAWYNHTQVPYVAHAYLANGNIIQLRPPVFGSAGNNANNHPDQRYWREYDGGHHQTAVLSITQAIQGAGGVANIRLIDIDCKLMPCAAGNQSCLFAVPALMRNYYRLNNIPLRIFSHADENMGGQGTGHGSSKRVIQCNTSDTTQVLTAAYNNHDGWGWIP